MIGKLRIILMLPLLVCFMLNGCGKSTEGVTMADKSTPPSEQVASTQTKENDEEEYATSDKISETPEPDEIEEQNTETIVPATAEPTTEYALTQEVDDMEGLITRRGFIVQDGELYYYDETGNLVTGWFNQNEKRYCARTDGRLYKSGEYEVDGVKYLFDKSGVCLGEMEERKEQLPIGDTLHLVFASGAGAWGTELELNKDGTFNGLYHDSNMGETGEGYPGGTVYFCSFSGKFDHIKQIDGYTYAMTLSELNSEYPADWKQIEDDILYISSEPYGIEDGKEFLFYTPEVPVNALSEDFLSWCMALGSPDNEGNGMLSYYGLYNQKMGYGFFGYK